MTQLAYNVKMVIIEIKSIQNFAHKMATIEIMDKIM